MSKLQAFFYLILAIVLLAALSYGFYKVMVYFFSQKYKNKI